MRSFPAKGEDQVERKRSALSLAVVAVVVLELLGATFVALAAGPGSPSPLAVGTSSTQTVTTTSSQTTSTASRLGTIPAGQRIGWWIADDDIFTTGNVMGTSLPWTPQQFYDNYFGTPPYPATMLWVSGLVSSGAAAVPSVQEAQWLSQVATLADSHANIKILMLFFVNLSGDSIETFVIGHSQCGFTDAKHGFLVKRVSPLTQVNIANACGLAPSTSYTLSLQDMNHATVSTLGSFATNSTGGLSATFAIPDQPTATNEPGNPANWYIVVNGTPLYSNVILQGDQTLQLTNYMAQLKGHPSIYGALFEPEYFANTPAIQATFRSIITGAGYFDLQGQADTQGDPILAYSSYPYFGGQLDTAPQANQVGVHYGETGVPLCGTDPCPIWTQATVLNIVDNSTPLPCAIIISENDVSNSAGNSYLWASPTLRGWVWSDPHYQSAYLLSTGGGTTTTTSATSSSSVTSSSSLTSTAQPTGSSISFSSYIAPFNYGQNFRTPSNSFTLQVPATSSINMIAFYLSDRAYDPNPIQFSVVGPNGVTLATGTLPGTPMFASQQYFPVQLSQTITLLANTPYQVQFGQLPAGDTYAISQDIIQEASGAGGSYLGQSQWPVFEVGLMNLLPQGGGLAYHNYGGFTDLFSSPGYQGTGEIAMRFQASQGETLQSFEVYVWSSDGSANPVTFALRPDSGGHPAGASSNMATGSLTAAQMSALQFATVAFPSPQLTAGATYWIVMSANGAQHVQLGRLVSPYREQVLYSTNDASWSVPPDGPTDLSFRITTSGESIVNTVSGSSSNSYFSGIAQSFIPGVSASLGGAWVSAAPSGQLMTVSIQTDSGSDSPSGSVLASGSDPISAQFTGGTQPFVYVGFTSPASVSPGTKYWLVVQMGSCLSSCSSPDKAATLTFASDYSLSGYAPPSGTHYETLSGSAWTSVPNGAMTFVLAAPAADPLPVTTTTTGATSTSASSSASTSSTSSTSSSATTSTATSAPTTTTSLVTTTTTTSTTTTSTSSTVTYVTSATSTTSFLTTATSSSSASQPSTATSAVTTSPPVTPTNSTYTPGITGFASNGAYDLSFVTPEGSTLQGASVTALVSVEPNSITSNQVSLHVASAPAGVTATLQPDHGTLPLTAILTLSASSGASPGSYTVVVTSVSKAGNESIAYSLTVERAAVNQPSSRSVTVTVHDVYGLPVSGARVTLNVAGASPSQETGNSGTVVFASVPQGTFNATVTYMGASTILSGSSSSDPQLEVTVVMSPPVAISAGVVFAFVAGVMLWKVKSKTPIYSYP